MSPKQSTRRGFLRLLAAGSVAAAALATPAVAAAATPVRRRRRPPATPVSPQPPAAVQEEVRKQKGYLDATLKVIREYELPPGSDIAFAFLALPPAPPSRVRRAPARPLQGGEPR